MRFSRCLKSSTQSLPSPNGAYIATVLHGKLMLRATRSLEVTHLITLPTEFTSNIHWLIWSLSANRILLSTVDFIRVFSVVDASFTGTISSPTSGTPQISHLAFGATDDEICVFSDFGLNLTIFNLATSTSVDIPCPKLFNNLNAAKGYSYRPQTSNLALLTRSGGKDIVSLHARISYKVLRSWHPDTVDAQQLSWSPDGRWLVVVESAYQGHKILVYTADGHLYKSWNGSMSSFDGALDNFMAAGVRIIAWSPTGNFLAVGDYSSNVTLLSVPLFAPTISLKHTTIIKPASHLQIWLEHVTVSQFGTIERSFTLSMQATCPPTASSPLGTGNASTKLGTSMILFNASGTLVATRPEYMPTSVWIWDITTKALKSIMIQHAPVARVTWHPTIDDLLFIRCEGQESTGFVYFWSSSWETPEVVNFVSHIPGGKVIGKSFVTWLNVELTIPAVFFSDTEDYILSSFSEFEDERPPWEDFVERDFDIYGVKGEPLLNRPDGDEKLPRRRDTIEALINEEPTTEMSGYSDEIDDTFQFKRAMDTT